MDSLINSLVQLYNMTVPESKVRVGLAYRETLLLVVGLRPSILRKEFVRFYDYFKDYISFPKKHIENYSMMLLKMYKNQTITYQDNRPVLTARGRAMVDVILENQDEGFKNKFDRYLQIRKDEIKGKNLI